jgi:diguanylate cyclase (GGDEF)-like protein
MLLRAKVLSLVVPLTVAPLLGLGWVAHEQLRELSEQRALAEMFTLLNQLSRDVVSRLEMAEANVRTFAKPPLVRQYVLTADEETRYAVMQRPLLKLFGSYLDAYPDYYKICLLLPDGDEEVRATRDRLPSRTEEEVGRPYFPALRDHPSHSFTTFYLDPDTDRHAFAVAYRLRLRDPNLDPALAEPKTRGYVVVNVGLEFLRTFIERNRVGNTGKAFFVDKAGNLLLDPDQESGGLRRTVPPGLLARLWEHGPLGRPFVHRRDGSPTMFASRPVHPSLLAVTALPVAELQAAGRRLGWFVLTITLGATLVTIMLLMLALNHQLIRPVRALRQATQAVSEGRELPDLRAAGQDEIGDLARSFVTMDERLRQSNDQITRLAYRDALTGLPNRTMFNEFMERALARMRREGGLAAVLFLDVDNFKRINDHLGHDVGDLLLKQLAERLCNQLREEDYTGRPGYAQGPEILSRLGGDEFIILISHLRSPRDAEVVAKRIIASFAEPFSTTGHTLYATTSMGIAIFPSDGSDGPSLVKNADLAMYHAKDQGRNTYRYYDESFNRASEARMTMENMLRGAVERDELSLVYQPQVNSFTGQIVALEALLRWEHPTAGSISPGQFIPIAEETGLILSIGEWVLDEACRQARIWRDAGLPPVTVAVNVSGLQFKRGDVPASVQRALQRWRLPGNSLDIELTESTLMADFEPVVKILEALNRLGVEVSLDDFGTGYASMSYLRHFPITNLKIDRSFVKSVTEHPEDAAIATAIVALARTLRLTAVAEGVETESQWAFLRDCGCERLQGFLFSRPVPAAAATELLRRGRLRLPREKVPLSAAEALGAGGRS